MTAPIMLVTWFHADDPAHPGSYSQIRGSSTSEANYRVYLRCVDVCVASFRRWNPDGPCLVVLNPGADAVVDDGRRRLWERLRVEVRIVENGHCPDRDLLSAWQNQFFLFDVMRVALEVNDDPGRPIIVVDSDVVVRAPLDGLGEDIAARGRVAMRIPYAEDELANGSSRLDLGDYVRERTGTVLPWVPAYQGGEFVGGTGATLRGLVDKAQDVYDWSLQRQRQGARHPNEEAHMLSVAEPIPETEATGNRWIERIWTKPWNLRAVPDEPRSIPLWHLPAEKKSGIRRLQASVVDSRSWFWTAPDPVWRARTEQILGVPRYGLAKFFRDLVALRGDLMAALLERVRG